MMQVLSSCNSRFKFETAIYKAQDKYTNAKFVQIDGAPNDGNGNSKVGENTVNIFFAENPNLSDDVMTKADEVYSKLKSGDITVDGEKGDLIKKDIFPNTRWSFSPPCSFQ